MASPAPPFDPSSPLYVFGAWRGRISRRTFWWYGVAALTGLGLVGHALLGIAGLPPERAAVVVNVLLAWPAIAVSAKRWQDRDRAPWWVLVHLIPVIGSLWSLVDNGFVRGSPTDNRFGPPPPQ